MARYNLRYQISLFADFSTLEPSNELYSQFESAYPNSKLLRVPFLENTVTPAGTQTRECVKVSTNDGVVSIVFRSDRVIFTWLNTDINRTDEISIGIFSNNVLSVVSKVDILKNTLYHRIGYVRYSLFDNPSSEIVYSHTNKTIPFLENLPKSDWTNYLPTRFVDGGGNEYNIVATVKHTTGPIKMNGETKPFDGIFVSIDVNTPNEVRNFIYNHDTLKNKINSLRELESKVSSQYQNLFNCVGNAE